MNSIPRIQTGPKRNQYDHIVNVRSNSHVEVEIIPDKYMSHEGMAVHKAFSARNF